MNFRSWIVWSIIIIVVGYMALNLQKSSMPKDLVLRIAFPFGKSATKYEPTRIFLDHEYVFLESIYSPLVEIDSSGQIVPGIAQKAYWQGNDLVFEIRESIRTQNGTPITAEDAAFSLKRLLVLSTNTHGDFNNTVCGNKSLLSVNDSCPGIEVNGNKLVLKVSKPNVFLLNMLAAMDFAVVPKASVDPKTLAIIDYSQTSGPYFVSRDSSEGNIQLKLNRTHYHAKPNVAETIELVSANDKSKTRALEDIEAGRVDHVTTVDQARFEDVVPFAKKNPQFQWHSTLKFRKLFLQFTSKGLKTLSKAERKYIASRVGNSFYTLYSSQDGIERTNEFFPSIGSGGLTKVQHEQLVKEQSLPEQAPAPSKKIQIGLLRSTALESWVSALTNELPDVHFYQELKIPEMNASDSNYEMPHAHVFWTDTNFQEDIGLLSYSMSAGHFGLPPAAGKRWLSDYMSVESKELRLETLRNLHFKALADFAIVPILATSYTALSRKPWKMNLSNMYANNQFWRITYEP